MDADMSKLPSDFFVTSNQFTKRVYRDVYPSIDPSSPALSQAGKIIIVSGASKGIGQRVCVAFSNFLLKHKRIPFQFTSI